jgi:hypothetical protein
VVTTLAVAVVVIGVLQTYQVQVEQAVVVKVVTEQPPLFSLLLELQTQAVVAVVPVETIQWFHQLAMVQQVVQALLSLVIYLPPKKQQVVILLFHLEDIFITHLLHQEHLTQRHLSLLKHQVEQ